MAPALLWHVQLVPIFYEFFSNKKNQNFFCEKNSGENKLGKNTYYFLFIITAVSNGEYTEMTQLG
jgi:hypothetical protein